MEDNTPEFIKKAHNRMGGVDSDKLKDFIERVERLQEEKSGIASDISDVYAAAKGSGYDPKTMRKVIRLRKMDADKREEEENMLDIYMHALGMLPLFENAEGPEGE